MCERESREGGKRQERGGPNGNKERQNYVGVWKHIKGEQRKENNGGFVSGSMNIYRKLCCIYIQSHVTLLTLNGA